MKNNIIYSCAVTLVAKKDSDQSLPSTTKFEKAVRVGGKGPEFNSPDCIEINKICDEIGLSGKEICEGLEEFDGQPLTRLSLQSYKQGIVLGQESYSALLARLKPYLAMRKEKYGYLMSSDGVQIIESWMELLKIDISSSEISPWKSFSDKIGKVRKNGKLIRIDHTTIYRWYKFNKKPFSITDLIWYDEIVKAAAKKI